jgi:HEPN domain-containing protein
LGINFQKNVIILNKTPIHSPRTNELRELCRLASKTEKRSNTALASALDESQIAMANLLVEFHEALETQVWITGYTKKKKGGIFEVYTNTLKELYIKKPEMYKQLFIFRHFSMNQFTIDLKKQTLPKETVAKSLKRIGTAYRQRILEG